MSRFGLIAVLVILLAPASALAADPPLRELHVPAYGLVPANLFVHAGKVYPIEVSGTARKVEPNVPNDYELSDAFYCYESTAHGRCPPAAKQPIQASILETELRGDIQFLWLNADGGQAPAYDANTHTYSYGFKPKKSGKLTFTTWGVCGDDKHCTGDGFDVKIFAPPDPCEATRRAHAAAVNEVRVAAVQPDVQVHRANTPEECLVPATKDMVLQQGDEIACDPDGSITLQFADNSTAVIKNTTQLKIASFFTEGGVTKTLILLKMGEVAAKVHKSEATKSDFRLVTPNMDGGSVRGRFVHRDVHARSTGDLAFSVFYDPGSKSSLVTTTEGVVDVDPTKPGLPTVQVPAGKEVEVTSTAESKVVAPGKAGARGGLNRRDALAKVMKVIAKGNGPCGVSTPRLNATSVKPAAGGWNVAVKLTGKHKGTSTWAVKGGRVKPGNALAKRVARGCR